MIQLHLCSPEIGKERNCFCSNMQVVPVHFPTNFMLVTDTSPIKSNYTKGAFLWVIEISARIRDPKSHAWIMVHQRNQMNESTLVTDSSVPSDLGSLIIPNRQRNAPLIHLLLSDWFPESWLVSQSFMHAQATKQVLAQEVKIEGELRKENSVKNVHR